MYTKYITDHLFSHRDEVYLLLHSNFGVSRFVMMGRRPDHRIWMMSQITFAEGSILLDLRAWQDQWSCAIGLEDTQTDGILSISHFQSVAVFFFFLLDKDSNYFVEYYLIFTELIFYCRNTRNSFMHVYIYVWYCIIINLKKYHVDI